MTESAPPAAKTQGDTALLFRRSCLIKAGLVLLVLAFAAVSGLVWGTFQVMGFFKTFTSATPLTLPENRPSPERIAEARQRVSEFLSSEPRQPAQLRLTADDLNALIAGAPGWDLFRNRLHFTIENNRLTALATFPLKNLPFFDGRYLNGQIELTPSVKKGHFLAGLQSFKSGERALPSYLLGPLSQAVSGVIERRVGGMGAIFGGATRITIEDNALLIEREPHPSPR